VIDSHEEGGLYSIRDEDILDEMEVVEEEGGGVGITQDERRKLTAQNRVGRSDASIDDSSGAVGNYGVDTGEYGDEGWEDAYEQEV
jgi:hypothetical protein